MHRKKGMKMWMIRNEVQIYTWHFISCTAQMADFNVPHVCPRRSAACLTSLILKTINVQRELLKSTKPMSSALLVTLWPTIWGVGVASWVLVDLRQCGSNRIPNLALLHTYNDERERELLALAHFYSDSEIPKRYY